jgi:2-amino-4-hydroxy-6-hydroxymethyldihydropteridine diphosphokinase
MPDQICIEQLRATGVIGLHNPERLTPQEILVTVILDLDIQQVAATDSVTGGVNYSDVSRSILTHIKTAERHTVETLATDIAGLCLVYPQVTQVHVRISKPAADKLAAAVAVEITRTFDSLASPALIGLASNDSALVNFKAAVDRLSIIGAVKKISTVYESPSEEGNPYLNTVVLVESCLPAAEIRRRLKKIEIDLGRTPASKSLNKMPIDLDLLMLGDQIIRASDVTIPDEDVLSREYLARGCAEVFPDAIYPVTRQTLRDIAQRLAGRMKLVARPDVAVNQWIAS